MAEVVPPHVWKQRRRVIWTSLLWAMSLPVLALAMSAPEGVVIAALGTAASVVTLIVGIYATTATWDDKNRKTAPVMHGGTVR